IAEANSIYLVRTYAYVAAGKQGLAIIDIEQPGRPRLDQVFDAGGKIDDARDVKVGMTNVSLFAYVADGRNGLRVVQLTSPEDTPGHYGFSPRPTPRLIATHHTHAPALAVSEGLDRDRAIDESGNQLSVFGRRGSRPLNLAEVQQLHLRRKPDGGVELFTVPEIKDSNRKENRDIRNFYGPPAVTDSDEPTGGPSEKSPAGLSSDVRQARETDYVGLAFLTLPLVITLLRWKRRSRK
ncbi:MAG TPA: hypothetical protein VJQ56_01130, partial [Blastocatellia bacterium]|nr:hypothetical protein [Blastocatellia bacterium]